MAIYQVTYVNYMNEDGEVTEFPADEFDSNHVELVTCDFVDYEVHEGEDFVREVWSYEVEDEDADRFESGLARIETAISWERVE